MKPHKHAELIKAWADGAEIEQRMYVKNSWFEEWANFDGVWHDSDIWQFRIKLNTKESEREMNEPCHKCGEYHNRCFELKDLTDEEILELTNDFSIFEYREFNDDMVRFARAILKKASEK